MRCLGRNFKTHPKTGLRYMVAVCDPYRKMDLEYSYEASSSCCGRILKTIFILGMNKITLHSGL
jgi:hypothetical protein